jgi:hypothetical protein
MLEENQQEKDQPRLTIDTDRSSKASKKKNLVNTLKVWKFVPSGAPLGTNLFPHFLIILISLYLIIYIFMILSKFQIPDNPEFTYYDGKAEKKVLQTRRTLAAVGKVLKARQKDLVHGRIQRGEVWFKVYILLLLIPRYLRSSSSGRRRRHCHYPPAQAWQREGLPVVACRA